MDLKSTLKTHPRTKDSTLGPGHINRNKISSKAKLNWSVVIFKVLVGDCSTSAYTANIKYRSNLCNIKMNTFYHSKYVLRVKGWSLLNKSLIQSITFVTLCCFDQSKWTVKSLFRWNFPLTSLCETIRLSGFQRVCDYSNKRAVLAVIMCLTVMQHIAASARSFLRKEHITACLNCFTSHGVVRAAGCALPLLLRPSENTVLSLNLAMYCRKTQVFLMRVLQNQSRGRNRLRCSYNTK